jgi:hypothetical protein
MSALVLDAGALIALERNDRLVWAALKLAAAAGDDVLVPAAALAQVWRGTPAQARLGRALEFCEIASFDDVARDAGVLCGKTRTSDICDAHVAIVAARRGGLLYTSDPSDLRKLLHACAANRTTIVRC